MFALLPVDEDERHNEDEYDDSSWSKEELQALAWEMGELKGREEDSEGYDEITET